MRRPATLSDYRKELFGNEQGVAAASGLPRANLEAPRQRLETAAIEIIAGNDSLGSGTSSCEP